MSTEAISPEGFSFFVPQFFVAHKNDNPADYKQNRPRAENEAKGDGCED